jgi:hypothetical protein
VSSKTPFDASQVALFESPQHLEDFFVKYRGELIGRYYVRRQLNQMLVNIRSNLMKPLHGWGTAFYEHNDVVYVRIEKRYAGGPNVCRFVLTDIKIRPCFWGQGMLTLIVYQLLYIALLVGGVKEVIVADCVPTTARILFRKFGPWVSFTGGLESSPDCEFLNLKKVGQELSAQKIGVSHKLISEDYGNLLLNEDAFPTSNQLNNVKWVETNHE